MWPFSAKPPPKPEEGVCCSFCSKGQREVAKIIAGPSVFICDECVDLSAGILAKEFAADGGRRAPAVRSGGFTGLSCGLCRSHVSLGDFVKVPDRGLLCLGCLEAVQALRHRDESETSRP
jgi:hypothetical protein